MIAIACLSSPSGAPLVTIEAVLSNGYRPYAHAGDPRIPDPTLPDGPPFFAALPGDPSAKRPVVDTLLSAMSGAGHSVAALSFYLGLAETDVRKRVQALGLPKAPDKPLRRSGSANRWSVVEVRSLIALWLDNVSAGSIASSLSRSLCSIHSKRRWLGLSVRDRKLVTDRPAAACQAIVLPWKPEVDVSKIAEWLQTPGLGRAPAPDMVKVDWVLGRDAEKDARFSILGFAGLTAETIAARMMMEFGVFLTVSAVNTRLGRLQIARDRWSLIRGFNEEVVRVRAAERMHKVGAVLRQCAELHRSFWWCRQISGNRSTCREFETGKRYASRRAERSCGDITAMAA